MEGMDVLKIILLLIGFCSLLFLTYITTKYIGGRQSKAMRGKNISIIESLPLGMDKRLHLVKAGKQYILIATTSKTVEYLTTIEPEDTEKDSEDFAQDKNVFDFASLFEKYAGMYKAKKDKNGGAPVNGTPQNIPERHDFKSNLSRLRMIVQKDKNQFEEIGDDNTNEK